MTGESKKMKDGSIAYLSSSGNYFIRREPTLRKWTHIFYYTLKGERIELAKGKCGDCGDIIKSKHCGDYVSCKCGKSAVDTNRCNPELHRYIGNIIN